MKKKFLINVTAFLLLAAFLTPVMVFASSDPFGLQDAEIDGLSTDTDVKGIIGNVIQIILGFLGIVAVIIILAGGFIWMTAGGNEDKVGKGRKLIINGVIGLIIILAAYSIAAFVIEQISTATNA